MWRSVQKGTESRLRLAPIGRARETVQGLCDQAPRDWLDGYPRLLEWADKSGLLRRQVLASLARLAEADPAAASDALARAKELREGLFAIATCLISGRAPPPDAMALLDRQWRAGVTAHELRYEEGEVRLELRAPAIDLDVIASLVAYRFAEAVLPQPRERLRICAGENCAWLFLDRSKAGRRRWCDMAVYGNAAKSRRFQARVRQGKARDPSRGSGA